MEHIEPVHVAEHEEGGAAQDVRRYNLRQTRKQKSKFQTNSMNSHCNDHVASVNLTNECTHFS